MSQKAKRQQSSPDRDPKENASKDRQLATRQEHYSLLLESLGAVIWTAQADSLAFTYVNKEAEAVFGYPRSDWTQNPNFLLSVLHPDDRERVIESRKLGYEHELTYRIYAQDGSLRHVRDVVRTSDDGHKQEKLGFMLDITLEVKQRQELEQSHQRFFNAFQSCPIPSTISRLDNGVVLDVNHSFIQASAYTREQLIGKSTLELGGWINEKDRERVRKVLQEGKAVRGLNVRMRDGNQHIREVEISATYLSIQDEAYMMLMYVDMSEQKRIQQKLKDTNRELEVFLYKSSHNLKGPIASLQGLLALALTEVKEPIALSYFEFLEQGVDGLQRTLDELLDITSIRQQEVQAEKLDLNTLIDEVVDKIKFIDNWGKITLLKNLAPEARFLHSDKSFLISIFQHLIENAIKYCDPHKAKNLLEIRSARLPNGPLVLEFEDNGLGIPEDKVAHVFEMFYRAHEQSKGTGLGLYIVQHSVDKLKGKVYVHSRRGEGTTLRLELPDLS